MRGLTEKELAKRSGLTQSYISALEKGHKLPSFEKYMLLCKALQVCPNKLTGYDMGCEDNCALTCKHFK